MHRDAERAAPVEQGVAEAPQAPADPPRPEALLDVRGHREHRRGAPRVRSRVRRVPVEPHAQPRVGQHLLAEPAQGQPRRDHPQVAQPRAEPREVAGAQGPVQHRLADEVPQPGRPVVKRLPGGAGAGAEGGVESRRDVGGVERQVDARAVGEPVAADRVDGFQLEVGGASGGGEQVGEHLRQREQRRPGVEGEPVAAVLPQLSAVGAGPLVQLHAVALRREPGGGGQPPDPGPDHDDPGHLRSRPDVRRADGRRGAAPSTSAPPGGAPATTRPAAPAAP